MDIYQNVGRGGVYVVCSLYKEQGAHIPQHQSSCTKYTMNSFYSCVRYRNKKGANNNHNNNNTSELARETSRQRTFIFFGVIRYACLVVHTHLSRITQSRIFPSSSSPFLYNISRDYLGLSRVCNEQFEKLNTQRHLYFYMVLL